MEYTKHFLNAHDVAEYMDVSEAMAYKIIRKLNDQLDKRGYITVSGKISKAYFEEKIYGADVVVRKEAQAHVSV